MFWRRRCSCWPRRRSAMTGPSRRACTRGPPPAVLGLEILEVSQRPEVLIPLLHIRERDLAQAVERELLHRERRQHAAEDRGAAELEVRHLAAGGEVTEEAAREGVARAGGVEDVLERIGRRGEDRVLRYQQHAVLAALDDERLRA